MEKWDTLDTCTNLLTTSGVMVIQRYVVFCVILSIYKVLKYSNKCPLPLPRGFPDKNITVCLRYSN